MSVSYKLVNGMLWAPEYSVGLTQRLAARQSNVGQYPRIVGHFAQGSSFGTSAQPSANDLCD
jgi:hypothetical protein